MHYTDPKPVWATELVMLFSLGFLVASLLWLGVWFFSVQPQYHAEADEKNAALATCATAREELQGQLEQLSTLNQNNDTKLGEVTTKLGRCVRDKVYLEKIYSQSQSAANPQ